MSRLTRYIPFRIEEKEYQRLKKIAKQNNYKSLSEFIRDTLLEHNGIASNAMKKEMYNLHWQINKIGVNINQATKRINSGLGSYEDIKILIANQEKLNLLMEEYLKEIERTWQ